jgi:uncharacterized membrane protein
MAGNQPRNLALGELDPQAPETARFWSRYVREWIRLNHVRTLACVVAAGLEMERSASAEARRTDESCRSRRS